LVKNASQSDVNAWWARLRGAGPGLWVTAIAFTVCGLVVAVGLLGGLQKTNGGEVAVVRNGGPLDNHKIRQEIDPASGLTWTGLWSSVHMYPAQQRFYTITSNAGRGDRTSELVSSCALVRNARGGLAPVGRSNNGNIAKVQQAINSSLTTDLQQTLGGRFFNDIRFNLVRITLPTKVQNAVDDAQAAFAQVTQAQARVQSARADAEANRIRQRGYRDCPACAQIDELKAIPRSVQTYAPGAGFAVTPRRIRRSA
jgi:hypothetical protein